jgi:predicted RNA-binding protein (TIGR00451 family)
MLTYTYISLDPEIMKKFQVDRGAIKFVLSGANIMCPGLTSPGGALDNEVDEETPVVEYFLLFYRCSMNEVDVM